MDVMKQVSIFSHIFPGVKFFIIFYSRYKTCVAEIAPQMLRMLAIIVTITVELAR
jgi:hypothetical protein